MPRIALVCVAATLACSNGGDAAREQSPTPPTTPAATPVVAEKMTVSLVGASVTVGFVYRKILGGESSNASFSVADVLNGLWKENLVVHQRGDLWTFRDALASGEKQVTQAANDSPDLVVAIDFLFWFAHKSGASHDERLERVKKGLALLDIIKVPIIVGDLPNMRGADPRMLAVSAVPSAETLQAVNGLVREFAASRKRVVIFPLAEWMERVRASGYVFELAAGPLKASRDELLQSDLLHASRLGMVAVADKLQPLVMNALASKALSKRSLREVFERLEVAIPSPTPSPPPTPTRPGP